LIISKPTIKAENYYNTIKEIKLYCMEKQINQFSTIRLERLTTLTCYERIRTMFCYKFKNTDIAVTIYKKQFFTDDNGNITIKMGRKDYRIHVNNTKKYFETDL